MIPVDPQQGLPPEPDLRDSLRAMAPEARGRLEATLLDDMVTEYDARFLVAFIRTLPIEFSSDFQEVFDQWADEEQAHHAAFRRVCELFRPGLQADLEARQPDFSGIAHLFGSEFEILCLLAYDELATVRGYRGNLELYDLLGPGFGAFLRRVVADEGRHYASFRGLLLQGHGDRLAEAPAVIRRIRGADGTPYRATFVLDHDDPIYGEEIFDETARVLERHLAHVVPDNVPA